MIWTTAGVLYLSNAREFWGKICLKTYAPDLKKKYPWKSIIIRGDVIADPESVRRNWKVCMDFEGLYSVANKTGDSDSEFLGDIEERVFSMEQTILDPL